MSRVYNFSAGPAVLPEEVLKEAADEMLDYKGTGMSVMEMSHRSKAYDTIIKEAEADLRELMNIPDNYKVLFLQGGASQQFAMIPMNLMKMVLPTISSQDSGQRKHIRRHVFLERQTRSHRVRTRPSLTYQTAQICRFRRMPTMYISVRTIPFMAPNSRHCQTQREKHLWQMCPHVFCQSQWM